MTQDWPEEIAEDLSPKGKRPSREERKALGRRDRSKYKKSDQDQLLKAKQRKSPSALPVGRVLSITAEGIIVDHEGTDLVCTLRRALLLEQRRVKSLVTIGDLVSYEVTGEGQGVVVEVTERYSFLARTAQSKRRRQQLIAANIDQVLITVSVVAPPLKPALVDRYVIAALKGNMEPVILVNKIDLLGEREGIEAFCENYGGLGYRVLCVSVKTGEKLQDLKEVMRDRASLFSGQSGVGKSSLINAVTGLALPVGEVIERTRKGAHTTTQARLIRLREGGFCIDTPGIGSFGMWELTVAELRHYFHDIGAEGEGCRFPNCSHTHEPDCAVLKALEAGSLSELRYRSYLTLLDEIQNTRKAR